MAGLVDLLLQAYSDQQKQENAFDPYSMAGASLAKAQPDYTNAKPWEQLLGSVIQGGLSGALMGYGKKNLIDTQTKDISDLTDTIQTALQEQGNQYDVMANALRQDSRFAPLAKTIEIAQVADKLEQQPLNDPLYQEVLKAAVSPEGITPDIASKIATLPLEKQRAINAFAQQAAIEDRFNRRETPAERALREKTEKAYEMVGTAQDVYEKLSKFDPNEEYSSALKRGVTANVLASTDAANLQRSLLVLAGQFRTPIVGSGTMSDWEQQMLQRAIGNQPGVTVGIIKGIVDKYATKAINNVQTTATLLEQAGKQNAYGNPAEKLFSSLKEAQQKTGWEQPTTGVGTPSVGANQRLGRDGQSVYQQRDDGSWIKVK